MSIRNALLSFADRALAALESPTMNPCCIEPNDHEFFWGMKNIPVNAACHHLAVLGTTGSGKTTLIQLFLQSIAHRFGPDAKRPEQLIIYDPKTNIIPLLKAAGLSTKSKNFWILNPVDERAAPWRLADAVKEPAYAREISRIFSPREKESKAPFFADGAANVLNAVMQGLNTIKGNSWSFRDLICAVESKERILAISSHDPRSGKIAANILDDNLHGAGVLSTLTTKMQNFEEVAALWHTSKNHESKNQFSVDGFLKKPGVLVIGFDAKFQEAITPTNSMILKALLGKILQQPDSDDIRHWFFLDEFPSLKDVGFIADLLNRGRSKGASLLLGAQSLPGLNEIYGKDRAEELLSLCSFKTFLRVGDPSTAEWMAKYVGKFRDWEEKYSEYHGEVTTSHEIQERDAVLASVFLNMPIPRPGGEFHMVNDLSSHGGLIFTRCMADDVFSMRKGVPDMKSAIERRKNPADQRLQPWTPEQEKFFCTPRDKAKKPPPAPEETKAPSADSPPKGELSKDPMTTDESASESGATLPDVKPHRKPPPLPGLSSEI